MTWNYRVIKKEHEPLNEFDDGVTYSIHEVYYDKHGDIEAWTLKAIGLGDFDDMDDLKGSMELMQKAFDKPVLLLTTINEDGAEKEKLIEL